MNKGDIVYFGEPYMARYSDNSPSGSYQYHFTPGDRYHIDDVNDFGLNGFGIRTGSITNLEDGTCHFAHTEIWSRIITKEEWRQKQLNKITSEDY